MVMEIGTGAFQAGDIYAAMSQNQEARRKREEKEAKEIDYLHLFKTYGMAGAAQKLGQGAANLLVDPVIKGAQALGKEVFVDPQVRETTRFLTGQTTGSTVKAQANNITTAYTNSKKAVTDHLQNGLTKTQAHEEILTNQVMPEVTAALIKEVEDSGGEINIDKFSDVHKKAIARKIINEKRFYRDSEGKLYDEKDLQNLSIMHDEQRKGKGLPLNFDKLYNTSLLDLRVQGYKDFVGGIETIPGGVETIKNFPNAVAKASTSRNAVDSVFNKAKDILYKTSLQDQGLSVLQNNLKEIDFTGRKIELNDEMKALKLISNLSRDAEEDRKFLNSVNGKAMIAKAMEKHSMLELADTIATTTAIEDKIESEITDKGEVIYKHVESLKTDSLGESVLVKEEKSLITTSNDTDGRLLAKNLQRSGNTNLNVMTKTLLSEDGRQELRRRVLEFYKSHENWKEFLTDGTGNMLSEFSSELNMEQYSWYAKQIDTVFKMEGGRFGLEKSASKNEAFKMFIQNYKQEWTEFQKAQAVYGNIKNSISNSRGELYDNSWLFENGDKKNDFDIKKYFNEKGAIIDGSIPPEKIKEAEEFGITENQLRAHMKNLQDGLVKKPLAIQDLNDRMQVIHSLYRDFRILTESEKPLTVGGTDAIRMGTQNKYIDAPAEPNIVEGDPPEVTSERRPYDSLSFKVQEEQPPTPTTRSLFEKPTDSVLKTLRKKNRELRGR